MAFICTKEAFVVSSLRVSMASISQHLGLHGYTHIDGLLLSSTHSTLGTRSFYKHLPNQIQITYLNFTAARPLGKWWFDKNHGGTNVGKMWWLYGEYMMLIWWLYGEYMGISLTHEGSPSHHGSFNPMGIESSMSTGDLQIMDYVWTKQMDMAMGQTFWTKDLPSGYD